MSQLAETSVNGNGVAETIVVFAITGACVCVGNTPRPQDGVGELLVCPRSGNGCTVFFGWQLGVFVPFLSDILADWTNSRIIRIDMVNAVFTT
jgi:hypothetical protein